MGAKIHVVANDKFIGFQVRGDDFAAQERNQGRLARLVSQHETTPLPEQPSRRHPLYSSILKLHVANEKIADLSSRIE